MKSFLGKFLEETCWWKVKTVKDWNMIYPRWKLTVPNLVSIQSVCKYTQLDEGKYDLGHICPNRQRLILTWGFTFIIFFEGYTPYEKTTYSIILYSTVGSGWVVFLKSFTRPRVKLNWGLSDSRISSVQGLRRFFTPTSSRVFSHFLRRFSRHHRTLTSF